MPSPSKKQRTWHFKKAELLKDEGKMTYRQRHKVQALEGESKSLLGDYQCVALCFCLCVCCGVVFVALFCHWCSSLLFQFSIRCTGDVIHPRLSPSSWWAQHRSKKRRECTSRSDRRNQVHKHTATTNTTPTQPQQFRRGSAKQFPVCNM